MQCKLNTTRCFRIDDQSRFICIFSFCNTTGLVNTLRPRQDRRHLADGIFTRIFFNENCCLLIKLSPKYVRKGPIDNISALVQIMAWRRSGDKPFSEQMMISLPTHTCVTPPQWVKAGQKIQSTWLNISIYANNHVFQYTSTRAKKSKQPEICWHTHTHIYI